MKEIRLTILIALVFIGVGSTGAIAHAIEPGSKVFLLYQMSEDGPDVDGEDAIGMLKTQLVGKTKLNVVLDLSDADFIVEFTAVKRGANNRRAKAVLKRAGSEEVVFETKWIRGTTNAFSGYSGTRHTIQRITKALINEFPSIER